MRINRLNLGAVSGLLVLLGAATARADGLGAGPYRAIGYAAGAVLVIVGIALSLSAVFGGLWLARRFRKKHQDDQP